MPAPFARRSQHFGRIPAKPRSRSQCLPCSDHSGQITDCGWGDRTWAGAHTQQIPLSVLLWRQGEERVHGPSTCLEMRQKALTRLTVSG